MGPPIDLGDGPSPPSIEVAHMMARLESRLLGDAPVSTRIGRFAVLERVGRGGMGIVFAAYDSELDRKVAIKLLHTELDEPGLRERLRREAQSMARLAHPNVATVFEIGEHEGRAFVAMEFVTGQTLRAWVDAAPRSWREIVDVYTQAGRGLAAAHEAGIVHRDFKPDNAIVGADMRVRVLDFGLAYTHEPFSSPPPPTLEDDIASASGRALLTREGTRLGTPAYMAPEQILGERGDARSDQFSFCVALWEALTGSRPFVGASLNDLHAHVLTGNIATPERRRLPKAIESALRQGLKRAPEDRHASIAELLRVLERDPHRARRRLGVVLAIAGVVVTGWGAQWARARSQRAACEESGAAIDEVWNPEIAARVSTGMRATGEALAEPTLERTLPALDERAREWRESRTTACLSAIDAPKHDQLPQTDACLQEASTAFAELVRALEAPDLDALQRAVPAIGALPRATDCLDERALARRAPPPDDDRASAIAEVQTELAGIRTAHALGHYTEALERSEPMLTRAKELDWAPLLARAHHTRGMAAMQLGDLARGESELEEAFFHAARTGLDTAAAESATQLVYLVGYQRARYDDALRWGRLGETMLARTDATDIARANLTGNLGLVDLHRGDFEEAFAKLAEALAGAEREYGPGHIDLSGKLSNLGEAQHGMGDIDAAIASYERAITIMEATLGPDHPRLAFPILGLADVAMTRGDHASALESYRRALALREQALGPDHSQTLWTLASLAVAMTRAGDQAAALATLEQAVARAEARPNGDDEVLAGMLTDLGLLEQDIGQPEKALPHLERALAIKERIFGMLHRELVATLVNLGNTERTLGRTADAQRHFARALQIGEESFGEDHPKLAHTMIGLGWTYVETGDVDRGLRLLEQAIALRERTLGPDTALVANALGHLVDALLGLGRARDAIEPAERAVTILRKTLTPVHPELAWALTSLGRAARDAGDETRASAVLEEALVIGESLHARGDLSDTWLADIRFALATVLEERERALVLARQANETYRTAGPRFADAFARTESFLRDDR